MWSCDSPLDGRFGGRAGGPGAARTYREHDRAAVAHQVCDLLWLDRPVEDHLDRLPPGVDQPLETIHQRQALGIAERRSDGHLDVRSEEHTSELQSLMRIS